jgi:hypothetical protein
MADSSREPAPFAALEREHFLATRFVAVLAAAAATGFATYWAEGNAAWLQWTVVAHAFMGALLSLVFAAYLGTHFKRTAGLRRHAASLLGILGVAGVLALLATGFPILASGQREAQRALYDAHILAAWAGPLLVGLHWLLARKRPRDKTPGLAWKSAGRATLAYTGITASAIALASLGYAFVPTPYRDAAAVQPYRLVYGEHPFRPSQTETGSGTFVDPRRLGDSGRCGACHQQITREWQASIHAQAGSDQAYQRNVNLLASKKGMPSTRYCEGCHAPVALLSGQLTDGGKLDTVGHLQEGVSCMTCHGIDQVVHVKGVASFRFAPQAPYLFEGYPDGWAVKLHNFVLRLRPLQHRADMARAPLPTPELCATCHVQFMDKDVNGWGWVQMQDDYTAWLGSPYSRQTRQSFSGTAVQRCQDCHFPLVAGDDPSANGAGLLRSHRALGANTAIPWFTGNREQLAGVEDFLRADKVRISIDIPDRPDAVRSSQHVAPSVAEVAEAPHYAYLGESLKFNVIATNAQVGHSFPGGTIDINEAWLHVKVVDGQNRTVFESGGLAESGEVDGGAYFYKSIPIDRQGNAVWRHDLFNMVGDSFKRVIPAGKSDIVPFEAKVPGWAKSPLTVSAVLRYRKFNPQYAHWALEDASLSLPIVDMAAESLAVAVRIKPEVEPGPALSKQ